MDVCGGGAWSGSGGELTGPRVVRMCPQCVHREGVLDPRVEVPPEEAVDLSVPAPLLSPIPRLRSSGASGERQPELVAQGLHSSLAAGAFSSSMKRLRTGLPALAAPAREHRSPDAALA